LGCLLVLCLFKALPDIKQSAVCYIIVGLIINDDQKL